MFTDRKTQYCQDAGPSQRHLQIQRQPNQSPSKLVCGCPHTGPGVDTQGQRPEEPAQSWRTAIVQVQDLV